MRSGRGCAPSPENFCISYIKMVSFYAIPDIFIDTNILFITAFNHMHSLNACTFVTCLLNVIDSLIFFFKKAP